MTKRFNENYISQAEEKIWKILGDTVEYDDYTQISLSVQDAVKAACNVWGISTDRQKDNMNKFINELIVDGLIPNLNKFDIKFSKK